MIYCIGDSFTAGDELPDYDPYAIGHKSQFAWPKLIEHYTNQKVVNLGKGGTGNTRIVKRCIDLAGQPTTDLIIIAWSNPKRFEMADDYGIWDVWSERNVSVLANERAQLVKWLAVHQNHPKIREFYQAAWLRQVILLQSYFRMIDQKYLMIQTHESDGFFTDNPNELFHLRDKIDNKYFIGWPDLSMMSYTIGCPIGPRGHFLVEGHRIIADKINEHIRNFGWFS